MKIIRVSQENQDQENTSQANPTDDFLKSVQKMRGQGLKEKKYYYSGPEDFLLQHGKHFGSQSLTKEESDYLKTLYGMTKRYKMKQCFYNAQSLAQISNGKIKYVEGYLHSGIIPIEHTWNVLNGKVLDFTMSHANNGKPILGIIPVGWDYFGIDLPTKMITQYWNKHKRSDAMIGNWMEDYPILKEKFYSP
jgi:hypothetical protein